MGRAPLLGHPRLLWYGDDFTGATDTLSVIAAAGLRTLLFMAVPDAVQLARAAQVLGGDLDAIGIAGATRSLDPESIRRELAPVGEFFARSACRLLHYKVCSTFDSAAQIGNIAAAVAALRPYVQHSWLPVVGGQPSLGRHCVFGHLFASAGLGGEIVRIDRHPTMSRHPMTPMHESDLRKHLAMQGLTRMLSWHYPNYDLDSARQDRLLETMVSADTAPMLMDVSRPGELPALGRLLWKAACDQPLLAVGPSSVSQALIANWQLNSGPALPDPAVAVAVAVANPIGPAPGPVFVFAGSLSPITAQQLAQASSYLRLPLRVEALLENGAAAHEARQTLIHALSEDQNTLVYTAPEHGVVADTSLSARIAVASAQWISLALEQIHARGIRLGRFGIAGGDTSSLAIKALPIWGLSYCGSIDNGVSLCRAHSDDPSLDGIQLILKGGQMGGGDTFERLAHGVQATVGH
jgi:3-oxoisoapionate kinase